MSNTPNHPPERTLPQISLDSLLPCSQQDAADKTAQMRDTNGGESEGLPLPKSIDRYEIHGLLGEGGYGRVFKAFDSQLQRHVAIKLPHLYLVTSKKALAGYLEEARTLAKLDHPAIVAVHDVGVTENGLPYIVSNFVDGNDLAHRVAASPLTLGDAIQMLMAIGDALAYVHARGIVHRDIKPANILLNGEQKPFLADFGLALRDEVPQPRSKRVGTPLYMSPEQARGESHLVDGRSDIFSLGVVMYELLTGRRPFIGETRESIMQNLLAKEAPPPRQLNRSVPRELERICLKALAKRSSDRYSTAADFVEDLRQFGSHLETDVRALEEETVADSLSDSRRETPVVPRGLRSFDRHDARFFCQLLPGPYDRDWVPESLLFWKRKLEHREADDSLRVGVLYGPSGCGKSSFAKAGLLPLLDDSISTVFVEATLAETEARLLRGIRKRFPNLNANSGLAQTLGEVRRNGSRLVLVIDQFEQWLHGRQDMDTSELAAALRQCDGQNVQCLLLLRDDFWLAASRFASILEVPLEQNHNVTLIDLFTMEHARKVLTEFGVAYDRLPESTADHTAQQEAFLDRAIQELSEDGKIIPVRLSVFVEMIKTQPWELSTLSRLGGVQGTGTQFLEEAFSNSRAPAAQRVHEPAVRQVLRQLLPEQGGNLKGTMRSEQDLLIASGYQNQLDRFHNMLTVLDNELRLISPTDPSGSALSDESLSESEDGTRYFQLTHDFLVPALYEWLNKKQRETRRGRAELRLAEYAALFSAKPNSQFTPSWLEWLSIRLHSSPQVWNEAERRLVRAADKRHLRSGSLVLIATLVIAVVGWGTRRRVNTNALVLQLQIAQTSELATILESLQQDHWFAPRAVREALDGSEPDSRSDTINRLALLPYEPSQSDVLRERLLSSPLPLAIAVRDQLVKNELLDPAWFLEKLTDTTQPDAVRFRAAVAVLSIETQRDGKMATDPLWEQLAPFLAAAMLRHSLKAPQDYTVLVDTIEPIKSPLLPQLAARCLQPEETPQRLAATGMLIHYLQDDPEQLLLHALDAAPEQHAAFLAVLDPTLPRMSEFLSRYAFAEIDPTISDEEFDRLSKRKGTAAGLLHRIGFNELTSSLLEHSEYPNARTYLIDRAATLGQDFDASIQQLASESNPVIRQGLIILLGKNDWTKWSEISRIKTISLFKRLFETDPDAGVHSAAHWALRRHEQADWLDTTIRQQAALPPDPRKNWYVNAEGYTMAIIDARNVPGIYRVFEISTSETTVAQYQRFHASHDYYLERSPTKDCPVGNANWFQCLRYCRWLARELNTDPEHAYPDDVTADTPASALAGVVEHGAYRLPTYIEWQYACAALTKSTRYFGWNDSLIDDYFWHWDISVNEKRQAVYRPSGTKIPNGFGLFALYDGVREWCHDHGDNLQRRVVMGSHSAQDHASIKSSSVIPSDLPNAKNGYYGLRVARTVTGPQ